MLERRVWDTMPLSPRDAIDIVRVVATAAAALWEREIMLNDIKAHNIMFGADGRVRIIDVGSIIHADGNAFSATFCPPEDPTTAPVAVVLLVMVFVVVVSIPALILYRPKAKARKRLDESRGRPPNPPRFL